MGVFDLLLIIVGLFFGWLIVFVRYKVLAVIVVVMHEVPRLRSG